MLFVSPVFLIYFLPIVLILYYFSNDKFKNPLLLIASLVFYSWGSPLFVFVLIGTTLVDFLLVRALASTEKHTTRKLLFTFSLILNIGLLVYFKYMNFFVNNFNAALQELGLQAGPTLNILLPLGISFFVFESLTYVIDVYKNEQKPIKRFSNYLLYIFFFPKMIAGPIVRYAEISSQIEGRFTTDSTYDFLNGFGRFTTGLAKKILIADVLGVYTNAYINNIDAGFSIQTSWLAAVTFTMQIYFDFSGYSDMAIGLARMLGFQLKENFNNPFNATSLTEFWKRWHMSFTRWIKQYIYIPLGGNRKSAGKNLFTLWIIFIISGLWHGAAWNYLIWGILHGLVLTTERVIQYKKWETKYKWATVPFTAVIVILITLLLKSTNLHSSSIWYASLFGLYKGSATLSMLTETKIALLLALMFSFITLSKVGKRLEVWWYDLDNKSTVSFKPILWIFLWVFSLTYITGHNFKSFIYYMF